MATNSAVPKPSTRVWRNIITMNRMRREAQNRLHNTSGRCASCGEGWGGDGVCPDCSPHRAMGGRTFEGELRHRR